MELQVFEISSQTETWLLLEKRCLKPPEGLIEAEQDL